VTIYERISGLVASHAKGDRERFRAQALTIAAEAEAKHPVFAKQVRMLIERMPEQMIALPMATRSFFDASAPAIMLDEMTLDPSVRERIERMFREHDAADRLRASGLEPMRKLLFVGPPGVGKTMMASAIAHRLGKPLMRVQLHATIAQHLGETAANLGKIFESICTYWGVYLFDEFDALAGARNSTDHDVGEMRRTVNSLLQFIENDDSPSIIIAATNRLEAVDRAMLRRFHDVIEFPIPTPEIATQLIESELLWPAGIDWARVREAAYGAGHADLVCACERVNKDAVLSDRTAVTTTELVAAILARRAPGAPTSAEVT
jgi:SpoVK/Ycf46/Vps4 family AAA+-type ATPase